MTAFQCDTFGARKLQLNVVSVDPRLYSRNEDLYAYGEIWWTTRQSSNGHARDLGKLDLGFQEPRGITKEGFFRRHSFLGKVSWSTGHFYESSKTYLQQEVIDPGVLRHGGEFPLYSNNLNQESINLPLEVYHDCSA